MTDDCIFCKIIKGDIPSYQVYEDDLFLGFLDINPFAAGHTLVVPKTHYRWTYNVPNFGQYWEVVNKIGHRIMDQLKPDYLSFWTFGNDIPHAHIHIVPRYIGDRYTGLVKPLKQQGDPVEIKKIADMIKL